MRLDFSKLNELPYRGCETDAERKERDRLVGAGFTVAEESMSLFDLPRPIQSARPMDSKGKPPAGQRKTFPPFTGADANRNYRSMYRAACEFHERHNPPHPEEEYWEKVCVDMERITHKFNQDPFLSALLVAIYEELGKELEALHPSADPDER